MPLDVFAVTQAFQKRLLRQERRAAAQMVRAYNNAWKRLKAQLLELQDEYNLYASQGIDIPGYWYYRSTRARALERQIAEELEKYASWSEKLISDEQKRVIEETLKHTDELIRIGLPPGVDISFHRINRRAVEAIVGINQPNSPLYRLFRSLSAEGTAKAQSALIQGVLLGYGPRKIAPMLRDALGITLSRALNIARTETIRAQRIATLENYRANQNVVKYWMWNAALDDRVCPACLAMHGTIHPLEEQMQSHPSCRCVASPVPYTWEELRERWGTGNGETSPTAENSEANLWSNNKEQFERMTDEQQRAILGNTRWLAWKDGLLNFDDFVKPTYDAEWGSGIAVPSLRETLGEDVKKEYQERARWHEKYGWDKEPE